MKTILDKLDEFGGPGRKSMKVPELKELLEKYDKAMKSGDRTSALSYIQRLENEIHHIASSARSYMASR